VPELAGDRPAQAVEGARPEVTPWVLGLRAPAGVTLPAMAVAFDALVAGSGPAGAVAALELARGGARVLLADPSPFPRDKACGDLIGPRGVRLLDDLGLTPRGARRVGDVVLIAPGGRSLRLPWPASRHYPAHVLAAPRATLDAQLREAALAAGAQPCAARVVALSDGGARLSTGREVRAEIVVGADGAMSRVAAAGGLVRSRDVFWAMAVRSYLDAVVEHPLIVFWQPRPGRTLPGYGWLFPGPDGRANVGLGIAVGNDRSRARTAARLLPEFLAQLRRAGRLGPGPVDDGTRRGGWLKLGMTGTVPAHGRVLLCGDAAGLVNPLQGEGIAEAMASGRSAATAILRDPASAAIAYRRTLVERHARFQSVAAALHAAALARPEAITRAGCALAAPGLGHAIAGGWAIWWNDLRDGAAPGPARAVAASLASIAGAVTAHSRVRRRVLAAGRR